jgi:hypothetical protein
MSIGSYEEFNTTYFLLNFLPYLKKIGQIFIGQNFMMIGTC